MSLASFRALDEGHVYHPYQRSAWEVAEANRRAEWLSERQPRPAEDWEHADDFEADCIEGERVRDEAEWLNIADWGD